MLCRHDISFNKFMRLLVNYLITLFNLTNFQPTNFQRVIYFINVFLRVVFYAFSENRNIEKLIIGKLEPFKIFHYLSVN